MGHLCENIRTKWTGFICWRTGFFCQRIGFIRCADKASFTAYEASPPVDEAIQPTDEARPIGHYICFSFFLFFQIFFLSAARVLLLESA